ncbi:ATP-binding cassette domain-containing protein [Thiocystis violascens]|uniref:ATP-binding protein Uup n=1 Tax=Thiocystis violascens (strain ATCC 17096 / DSM 198 / 6111) TaxID=765911 RepID=I3Y5R3_THIV6|nr:ATP-binding cassette domain-containing protein [Thiocystis violascens]AFL72331.1 ATPase component of ABC transporters with duplicated ATPase domain [Thiocystis violascens DSM 198]
MPLLNLDSISLSYGQPPLLEDVTLTIDRGERICLIGRNGAGKSTLLRIIAGEAQADSGQVRVVQGVTIAKLAQEIPREQTNATVFEVVADGLGDLGGLVQEYFRLSHGLGASASEGELDRLARVQQQLEDRNGWEIERRTERVITRLGLDAEAQFQSLSGGLQRRVLLARALVIEPDLLLLDEPTNHLDIESINWLEEFLLDFPGSLLFVTHDRRFLQRVATRILEIDRGRITDWPGDYANYLRRREERLHAESIAVEQFDRKLAEEEVWIRQGVKARRTRNEGRVRALKALREERRERREQQGTARLRVSDAERSGKLVVEAEGVTYGWGERPVIRDFSTLILRGDKIGIIGPNGVGKSTLLKLLLGDLEPQGGRIQRGTNLQVAYFDQLRAQLDLEKSVQDNVAGGSDQIEIDGQSRHVLSYLKDFLFTPERARQPVKALSGGERNRLLLAKLFTRPANLLVLDEPTNDLDTETLELLEELLVQFAGTLLLVSHDRVMLDNVVTSTLVFEGDGRVNDYVGGYEDWLRQRPVPVASARPAETKPKPAESGPETAKSKRGADKLSFKETRELAELPARIESLEQEQSALHTRMADPALYQTDGGEVAKVKTRLEVVDAALEDAYARWETLEARR